MTSECSRVRRKHRGKLSSVLCAFIRTTNIPVQRCAFAISNVLPSTHVVSTPTLQVLYVITTTQVVTGMSVLCTPYKCRALTRVKSHSQSIPNPGNAPSHTIPFGQASHTLLPKIDPVIKHLHDMSAPRIHVGMDLTDRRVL